MSHEEPTRALEALLSGEKDAAETLLPLLYGELKRLAEHRLSRLPAGQTLQATALVHEAYMRLVGDKDPGWQGRGHFFGAAARAMRDILVERARHKGRLKRGGGRRRLDMDEGMEISHEGGAGSDDGAFDEGQILSLDRALRRMETQYPRASEIVMYRSFAGLDSEQIAAIMGISSRTVERDWRFARAWLHRAIESDGQEALA